MYVSTGHCWLFTHVLSLLCAIWFIALWLLAAIGGCSGGVVGRRVGYWSLCFPSLENIVFQDHHCTVTCVEQEELWCFSLFFFGLLFFGSSFGFFSLWADLCVYSMESASPSYSKCPLKTMYGFGCLFYNGLNLIRVMVTCCMVLFELNVITFACVCVLFSILNPSTVSS